MSEQDGSTEKPKPTPKDPSVLAKVMERTMLSGAAAMSGGPLIPRSRVTFDIDHEHCAPGMFAEDISLTLESLSSGEEMKAIGSVNGGAEVMHILARLSMVEINGSKLDQNQRDFLWEALGNARQVVILMYGEIGAAPPSALGKARATITRS